MRSNLRSPRGSALQPAAEGKECTRLDVTAKSQTEFSGAIDCDSLRY